ncbi:MAG TPA: class II aldolase/adducin family protein [Candidatus Sulfotelmatobacter sp.]|nr:class II aldolase/adducin family protein [Candidatus Sulfotelmatobacter sp.]
MSGLDQLREEVFEANLGIYRAGLVTMHSGNASGIDREKKRIVIKPSGVDYEKLSPSLLVVTDLNGGRLKTGSPGDDLNPSVDLPHHAYLYKHCSEIGGIVHTHSNYATSFAVLNRPIAACLTAIADEFGGEIPCAPYVDNVGNHIGEAILKYRTQAPAILLGHHGAFTFGPSAKAAFKTAVMLEDVAKTCHLAALLGQAESLPAQEIQKWYMRYHSVYGQAQRSCTEEKRPKRRAR